MGMREYILKSGLGPEIANRRKYTDQEIRDAMLEGKVIDVDVLQCSSDLTLKVKLNHKLYGYIKFEDAYLGYGVGAKKIKKRDMLRLVGRVVKATVTEIYEDKAGKITSVGLSRRNAQTIFIESVLEQIKPGTILMGKVISTEVFGIFVDIGCGITGLLRSDSLCMSRPDDDAMLGAFRVGDVIPVIVKEVANSKVQLSYKELLGTWKENVAHWGIEVGSTVVGKVSSIVNYGIFVELAPNLIGLAEYKDDIEVGDHVTVFIKNVVPNKMKVKLQIVSKVEHGAYPNKLNERFLDKDVERIETWVYSSEDAQRHIESCYGDEFIDDISAELSTIKETPSEEIYDSTDAQAPDTVKHVE